MPTTKTIEESKAEIKAKLKPEPAKKPEVKEPIVTTEVKEPEAPKVEKLQEEKPTESIVAPVNEPIATVAPAEIKNGQLQLTDRHLELIKKTIAKNATPEEFDLFVMMARKTRLDPLMRQLYFMKYKDRRASERAGCKCYGECTCGKAVYSPATYITSIDGYRIIAHRTGDFAGVDEPSYQYHPKSGALTGCTMKVYRKSSTRPFAATAEFSEYNTGREMWQRMPKTMISKVAEALALRKAFPNDLAGVYIAEEMDQADANPAKSLPASVEPKAVRAMTKGQMELIIAVAKRKGGDEWQAKLKTYVQKRFGRDTMQGMTYDQGESIISVLTKLPDPQPKAATPEEATAIFTEGQPETPKQQTIGGMPEQYVSLDDIPDDLGANL